MAEIREYLSKIAVIVLLSRLVYSYENAYDLSERRNNRRDDPSQRFYESSERYFNRDRYSTHNTNPTSVYATVRPVDNEYFSRLPISSYGNGYDNLGNDFYTGPLRDRRRFQEPGRFRGRTRFDKPKTDFVTKDRSFDSFRDENVDDGFSQRSFLTNDRHHNDHFSPSLFRRSDEPFQESFGFDSSTDHRPFDFARERTKFKPTSIPPLRRDDLEEAFGTGTKRFEKYHPSSGNGRFDNEGQWGRNSYPVEQPHEYPPFYRKDYFAPTSKKLSGYEGSKADNSYQKSSGEKENSGLSKVGSYITSNEDKNLKKAEAGYHDNKEGTKLDVENKEKIGETSRFDKNGGNKSTVRSNRVHKKGHATKGFATHHHKDETGNTTTFFDESSDDGGQNDYRDLQDEFGTRRMSEVLNGKEDSRFFQNTAGKNGTFGNGILKDNKKVEKDIVANDNRFNNEENYGGGQDNVEKGFKTASEYIGGGIWQDR